MEEHYPEILRRYMGEERDGSFEYNDKTTKKAADICGASQSSSDATKGTEPINRKESAEYSDQVTSCMDRKETTVTFFNVLTKPVL